MNSWYFCRRFCWFEFLNCLLRNSGLTWTDCTSSLYSRTLAMFKQHQLRYWSHMCSMSPLLLMLLGYHPWVLLPYLWYDYIQICKYFHLFDRRLRNCFILTLILCILPLTFIRITCAARNQQNARDSHHKICCGKWTRRPEERGDICGHYWENQCYI